ncbi:MAG: T9SS type A sorting domain-containing protein [Bacteroidota bacterium]
MLKKVTLLFAVVLMFASVSNAQWGNQGQWPTTAPFVTGQNHSMAVDPDGKVWIGRWAAVVKHGVAPGDTLKKPVYLVYVFNPDGTQASFSPIWRILGDTLFTTNRGMRVGSDGNILFTTGSQPVSLPNFPAAIPQHLYNVNYKTGVGIKKVQLKYTAAAPAVDGNGNIFIAPVVPAASGAPMEIYDKNLTLIGNALNATVGFSRSFEVSRDGNTIYWAGYNNGVVYVYNRADEFSAFALKDSLMKGAKAESFTWHPINKNQLWISGGSQNDLPSGRFTKGTWYAYDVVQKKVVDSLKWRWKDWTSEATKAERPRALAFSLDGKTAYIGTFGIATSDLCQRVVQGGVDVKKLEEMPAQYELSQNYPNPFNPATKIKFSMPVEGMVSLKVYNVVGEEVETLLDTYKGAGSYEVSFDASNLSSGVYMYTLRTEKMSLTKKMILVK